MAKSRIPNVTDARIISTLLPGAKTYNFTVTTDEFDEFDNAGPGHYVGVEVDQEVAEKWNEGLRLCKDRGLNPRSWDGLLLRYNISRRQGRERSYLPKPLQKLAREYEETQREKEERQERIRAFDAHKEGFVAVGPDEYSSGPHHRLNPIAKLSREDSEYPYDRALYPLPNGDMVEVIGNGLSWTRWTKDPDVVHDRFVRKSIVQYVYRQDLFEVLAGLERDGYLKLGYYSWFGGLPKSATRYQGAYGGFNNSTAEEKVQRLQDHLQKCLVRHPIAEDRIRKAMELAKSGSIEAC